MKYILVVIIFSTCVINVKAESDSNFTKNRFIASFDASIKDAGLTGVAIAVVRANGKNWTYGSGYADIATQTPMTPNSIIATASISKTVTGVAAMQLVEKGELQLNSSIDNFLPYKVENPKHLGHPITLRHALTHTTGIRDFDGIYNSDIVYHYGGDNPLSLSQFVHDYLSKTGQYYSPEDNFIDALPGSYYEYSNIVFGLIGAVVEQVSDKSFDRFTQDNIFKPLGMNASSWRYDEVAKENIATQYVQTNSTYTKDQLTGDEFNGWRAIKPYGLATYPDGGLRTSVSDLSRFLAAIMNEGEFQGKRILLEKTVRQMLTKQTFETSDGEIYTHSKRGLVFSLRKMKDIEVKGHTGSDPGVNTYMFFDPLKKVGAIFFTNCSMYNTEQRDLAKSIMVELMQNVDEFIPN